MNSTRKVFLANAVWENQHQVETFFKRNSWVSQDPKEMLEIQSLVTEKDVLILFDATVTSRLMIYGFGLVKEVQPSEMMMSWYGKERIQTKFDWSSEGGGDLIALEYMALEALWSSLPEGNFKEFLQKEMSLKVDISKTSIKEKSVNRKTSKQSVSAINELLKARTYYLASYLWNDESRLDEFVHSGRWENGNKNKVTHAVNSAQAGDVVFAKSVWNKDNSGNFLTIRAVGVVAKNHKDGHRLNVKWHLLPEQLDLTVGTHYRLAFQEIRETFLQEILEEILKNVGNLSELIEELMEQVKIDERMYENVLSRAIIDNDGAFTSTDLLNIENDVRSFALLLASREIKPPLAIALFGKWGSGKSFFMKQLKSRVDQLSRNQQFSEEKLDSNHFCKGIAQIEFNAWSYLDSNLWAGLISSIFEKLDEYISQRSKGEEQKLFIRKELSERLVVLSSEREQMQEKKSVLKDKRDKLDEKLKRLKERKKTELEQVAGIKLENLIQNALQQVKLSPDLKNQLKRYGFTEGRIRSMDPSTLVDEVRSWTTFTRNLMHLSLGQNVVFGVIVVIIGVAYLLGDFWEYYLPELNRNISILMATVVPVVGKLMNTFNKYRKLLNPVRDYKNQYNHALEKERFDHQKQVALIETSLQQHESRILDVENQLKSINSQISDLNYTLDHFVAQRAFNNFIQKKVVNKEYDSHLGLISFIRRDFETLSELFSEVNAERAIADFKPEGEENVDPENPTKFKELFKDNRVLDRIVLYIDDLDRCSDDKVLEVVQAVHLLMAFPLFNVVVGVDQRCIRNALLLKTKLEYRKIASIAEIEEMGVELILPEEYLEKIFQIPFVLREPEDNDLRKLVRGVLSSDEKVVVVEESDEQESEAEEAMGDDVVVTAVGDKHDQLATKAAHGSPKTVSVKTKRAQKKEPEKDLVGIESLELTGVEISALTDLASIVGNTPRTIKRYLNIYRMIRSHTVLRYDKDSEQEVYLLLMFLLGIGAGKYKQYMEELITEMKAHPDLTIKEVVKKALSNEADALIVSLESKDNVSKLLSYQSAIIDSEIIQFITRFSFGKEIMNG